jgi:transposase InsO family protein
MRCSTDGDRHPKRSGSLKSERLCDRKYEARNEAKNDILKYIEMSYNRKRRHAALGHISWAAYGKIYERKQQQTASTPVKSKRISKEGL